MSANFKKNYWKFRKVCEVSSRIKKLNYKSYSRILTFFWAYRKINFLNESSNEELKLRKLFLNFEIYLSFHENHIFERKLIFWKAQMKSSNYKTIPGFWNFFWAFRKIKFWTKAQITKAIRGFWDFFELSGKSIFWTKAQMKSSNYESYSWILRFISALAKIIFLNESSNFEKLKWKTEITKLFEDFKFFWAFRKIKFLNERSNFEKL